MFCSVRANPDCGVAEAQAGGERQVRVGMSNRDNKAAAAEFRELFGIDFDEFTRQAPVKLLLALAEFAEPIDLTVLRFAEVSHPLFQQERERLARALRHAWQVKAPDIAERRRQITQVVRRGGIKSRDEEVGERKGGGGATTQ